MKAYWVFVFFALMIVARVAVGFSPARHWHWGYQTAAMWMIIWVGLMLFFGIARYIKKDSN